MLTVNTSAKLVRDLQFAALGGSWTDFSNGCLHPPEVALRGAPDKVMIGIRKEADRVAFHTVAVPCRKCEVCLENRGKRWAAKAATECAAASRTWFCTFTVRPRERFKFKLNAQYRATSRGCIWSDLSEAEQFAYIHHEIGPELTKWIKRIRKNSGAKLRYLLVVEAHKDGFPHYHMLLHEYDEPISWADLSLNWKLGFSSFKVVKTDRAPWYITKYISKSALARVRASIQYGPVYSAGRLTERVLRATGSAHVGLWALPLVSPV